MKIVITQKQGYSTRDGHEYPRGAEADFDERLASKLIRYRIASPAPEPEPKKKAAPVVETAELAAPENTAKRTSKPPARKSSPSAKEG